MARFLPLSLWIISTLVLACFHEPWRDEAQAWLVARHSPDIVELLFRASIEATGPLYYLWLWPFARLFPNGFPTLHFFLSWTGTALAVWTLLEDRRIPKSVRWLVAFGYLFGFEYASVARLYGWGCFFFLRGTRDDRWSFAWLSAAVLVQLNVVFAVLGWAVYRRKYAALLIPLALHLLLLQWTQQARAEAWHFSTSLTKLGSTLMGPLVQMPGSVGLAGLVAFPLALWILPWRAVQGYLAGVIPFSFLYLFRYYGHPQSRHSGALAVLFVMLAGLSWRDLSGQKRAVVYLFLGLSFVGGLLGRGQDILYPFSDAASLAAKIDPQSKPWLVTDYPYAGIVASAILDIPLWHKGERIGRPFGPTETEKSPELCPKEHTCYFIGDKPVEETLFKDVGTWELLQPKSAWTIAPESLYLYRLK